MSKKPLSKILGIVIPTVYGIFLAGFGTYSVVDTLFIPKAKQKVSFDFGQYNSSSSIKDPSSKSNSSAQSSSGATSGSQNSSSGNSSSSNTGISDDLFSDTVVLTENQYIDQNLHIDIHTEVIQTRHLREDRLMDTTVYCAHVYVRHFSHLRTSFSHDLYGDNLTEWTSKNAKRQGAIFAINGDNYGGQEAGYVLRNGQIFRNTARRNTEDVVMYKDGSFETYLEKDYTLEQIKDKNGVDSAWQVWSFGPALVKNGQRAVAESDEVDVFSRYGNQRCSIGMVEPYHYVCAVCDGRLDESYGMQLFEMADYMIKEGCQVAYNLDGGGSSSFVFNDVRMNKPLTNPGEQIKERGVSDIVYFA